MLLSKNKMQSAFKNDICENIYI